MYQFIESNILFCLIVHFTAQTMQHLHLLILDSFRLMYVSVDLKAEEKSKQASLIGLVYAWKVLNQSLRQYVIT